MGTMGEMMAASCDVGIGYAERMLAGIQPADFGRFARSDGEPIVSNHPAFVFGHLSLYPERVVSQLQRDADSVAPSQSYAQLFSHEATCVDDPDGSIYPPMEEVVERMLRGYRQASEVLRSAEDGLFLQENPLERLRSKFPTVGAALGFYVSGHMMMHLGQLSAWRRAMGLGPA